jgi:hypothetical protein
MFQKLQAVMDNIIDAIIFNFLFYSPLARTVSKEIMNCYIFSPLKKITGRVTGRVCEKMAKSFAQPIFVKITCSVKKVVYVHICATSVFFFFFYLLRYFCKLTKLPK